MALKKYRRQVIRVRDANDELPEVILSTGDEAGRIIQLVITGGENYGTHCRFWLQKEEGLNVYQDMEQVTASYPTWEAAINTGGLEPGVYPCMFRIGDNDGSVTETFKTTARVLQGMLIDAEESEEMQSQLSEFEQRTEDAIAANEIATTAANDATDAATAATSAIEHALDEVDVRVLTTGVLSVTNVDGVPTSYDVKQQVSDAINPKIEDADAATQAANDAATAANSAATSATDAAAAATNAASAATQATTAANSAASSAISAAGDASAAATSANSAATAATSAAAAANTAAEQVAPTITEVQNIRVGADGVTYQSAGDAVRGQVANLQDELEDNLLDFLETKYPDNWLNFDGLVAGELKANGTIVESTSRMYTNYFIPVSEGDKIRYRRMDNGNSAYMRGFAAYDSDKNVLVNKGSNSSGTIYTVASGVSYVKITIDNVHSSTTVMPMLSVDQGTPAPYSPYFNPYNIFTKDFLTEESESLIDDIADGINTSFLEHNWACSFPYGNLKQTVGIPETFYLSTGITPDKTMYPIMRAGIEYAVMVDNTSIEFTNQNSLISSNGFTWRMLDPLFVTVKTNVTQAALAGQPRNIIEENLSNCSMLVIGDSTVDQEVMTQKLLDHFVSQNKTLTLLGTLGSGDNKNEGRAGWKASDYLTDRQYQGITNPFYNPSTATFDFSYYMTNQGYLTPDFVVLQLGINDLGSTEDYASIWTCIKTMIDSILTYDNTIKILLNLPTTPTSDASKIEMNIFIYKNRVVHYDEYAIEHAKSEYPVSNVRCTYCHLILNPDSDIYDNVHPNAGGYEKMALEIANQINHWQNGD